MCCIVVSIVNYKYYIFAIIIEVMIVIGIISMPILSNLWMSKHKIDLFDKLHKSDMVSSSLKDCMKINSQITNSSLLFFSYINSLKLNNTCSCSRSVVSRAMVEQVKYLIKYTKLEYTDEEFAKLKCCYDFLNTVKSLCRNLEDIQVCLRSYVPWYVWLFINKTKVSYFVCGLDYVYYNNLFQRLDKIMFRFEYVSEKGNSVLCCDITIDDRVLMSLCSELEHGISKNKFAKIQRGKMTPALREYILRRDNYICQICGNSIYKDSDIIFHIDHIIPVSKGGRTEISNLQTLCRSCNLHKSDKIL